MSIRAELAKIYTLDEVRQLGFRYAEPWRHYHTWNHIEHMLHTLELVEHDGWRIHEPMMCVIFALWHDAVYDPQSAPGRNETLSAQLCAKETYSLHIPPATVDRACRVILRTVDHVIDPTVPDSDILLDIDKSILAADDEEFAQYCDDIRREYHHVDEETYTKARIEILQGFQNQIGIFTTRYGDKMWEGKAQRNLKREIKRLCEK